MFLFFTSLIIFIEGKCLLNFEKLFFKTCVKMFFLLHILVQTLNKGINKYSDYFRKTTYSNVIFAALFLTVLGLYFF